MQISRDLLRSTRASIRTHRGLIVVFIIVTLAILASFLLFFKGFPQVSYAQTNTTKTDSSTGIGTSIGYYDVPEVPFATPEYGPIGALAALIACFVAFAVYVKRNKLSDNSNA